MAIRVCDNQKTFTIQTLNSTYQMKVDEYGALLHTYYGASVDETDFSYLIMPADHGYSGQPGDVGDVRTYSHDFYPMEYSAFGSGDFRVPALKAGRPSVGPMMDLRFVSYEIVQGKYMLPGMPAMFAGGEGFDQIQNSVYSETTDLRFTTSDQDVETLVITLKDVYDDVYVKLLYGVFAEKDVITRAAVIENRGEEKVELTRVMSAGLDFLNGDMDVLHFWGKHCGERQMERRPLLHGITEVSSNRGSSSHQHNPFVILCDHEATENFGSCYAMSLIYSGSFRMQIEKDQYESVRLVAGLSDEEFRWTLKQGESFASPELAMAFAAEGISSLTRKLQHAYQEHLVRSPWKNKIRPVLVNNWEATYMDFNAEKLMAIARQAAEMDLDMLVLDDGWFGKRDSDNSGLGDWFVNEEKLGCSLKDLVKDINDLGLKFGLWFELEVVSEDSDLFRAHPDWALTVPGRKPTRSRYQLTLDMSNPEVVAYLKGRMDELLGTTNIEYIKWDFNCSTHNVYSHVHPELSQGAVRHLCILGMYELSEYILNKYPYIILEGCYGGGGRFDAGMLYYAPQIWTSDNTDAIDRLNIQYGTSFGYPMSAVSAHVSVCPNHQNHRVTPFKTRGICAMHGSFGYELDLSKLSEEDKTEAKRQVALYKKYAELFQKGDYYRLVSPFENPDFTAWSYVSADKSQASLSVVYTNQHGNPNAVRIKMKGLQADALYDVDGKTYSGTALMNGGLLLPLPKENYDSYMVCINRK